MKNSMDNSAEKTEKFNQQAEHKKATKKSKGVTLIELAISTIIFGVLSVSVASIMSSGVHNQMAIRVHEYEQTAALNILDRMRMDLLAAENIVATNNNQTLTFTSYTFTPNGENVVWSLANGVATRNGVAYHQTPSPNIALNVACGGFGQPCFQLNASPTNPALVNSVTLNELVLSHNMPQGTGSPLDQEFGPAQYRVNEFSFDVLTGYQFQ